MQEHPLDRPVWNALTTRQAHLAIGGARALRIDPDHGLFAAAADTSPESLMALGDIVPAGIPVGTVEAAEWPAVPGVDNAPPVPVVQMLAGESLGLVPARGFGIVDLTDAQGPDMLALATLTRPGPFFGRTHRMGDFVGVVVDGQIAAMAGERLRLPGFTEVSAVCTHPDHRGHGYAAALMSVVAGRILARGETPFLHVYPHNAPAIRIYEQLGYRIRAEMKLTMLTRA